MTDKRPSSTKLRRQVFEANRYTCPLTGRILMTCHICGGPIDPAREPWEADHVIRRVLSESDSVDGIKPAHDACHLGKTAVDVRENAKGKRTRDKHFHIERKHKKQWKLPGMKYDWSARRYVREGADE